MVKTIVSKEQYDQVRNIERISELKIKDVFAPVVDCVDGQWGLWNVIRCYSSGDKYIADMELAVKAENQEKAIILWELLQLMGKEEMEKGNPNVGRVGGN